MANKRISDLTNQATIANADLLEVQVSGEVVTKKATVEVVTKTERDARIAQDDVIEASCGLTAAGAYPGFTGSNYLDATTDIYDALDTLDGALASTGSSIVVDIIPVSAANLNNAGIAPFSIIAAPGATSYIELLDCSIYLNAVSVDVECGSQKLVLGYDTGSSHFMEWANAFIESGSDVCNKGTWTSEVAMMLNKKIQLTFDGGVNPTAGDTTLKVWVTYIIRDTTAS